MRDFAFLRRHRSRYGLAFGERFVTAARSGSRRNEGDSQAVWQEIPDGLVTASPVELNVRAVSELARLAGEALEAVGGVGQPVALVLPDLAIRTFVFSKEETTSRDALVARVTPRLAYPVSDAQIDRWQGPTGWTIVASIRRAVLQQYEQAVEALGSRVVWVDGASLVRVPLWADDALDRLATESSSGLHAHLQIYSRHYSVTVFRAGELLDVRLKIREPGGIEKVLEEISRLPSFFEGELSELSVRGDGARSVAERLGASGERRVRVHLGEEGEESHLRSLLEIVARRF